MQFDARPVHVGLVAGKVVQGQVLLHVLWLSLVSIIPLMLHTQSCIYINAM